MPNRIEARSAKAALTNATGRLPLLRLFSTPLPRKTRVTHLESPSLSGAFFIPIGGPQAHDKLRRKSRLNPFGINRPWKCGFHLHGWAAGPWELTTRGAEC
jgi:hypothetical protein